MNYSENALFIIDNLDYILEDIEPIILKLRAKHSHFKDEFRLEYEQKYYDNVYGILSQYISVQTNVSIPDIEDEMNYINENSNNLLWGRIYERFKL